MPMNDAALLSGTRKHTLKRGRPSAEQARAIGNSILLSALQMFLENGYEATSMEAVAKLAGVPRSTLYKRYDDKRALLRDVIALRIAQLSTVSARNNHRLTENLVERLEFYVASILVWGSHPEVDAVNHLAYHAWPSREETEERLQILGLPIMVDRIAHDIAIYGPASGLEASDPHKIANAIMGMIAGWQALHSSTSQVTQAEADEVARFTVALISRGGAAW